MTALEARCRSCAFPNLAPVLSLGCLPLANGLLRADQLDREEPRYPLDLVFCGSCGLVQITETVTPAILFQHYLYFTSFSDTALRNARELALRLVSERQLGPRSLVIEIASNDGYLLRHYAETGIPVVGVEPAANVARVAEQQGVRTVVAFFGLDVARTLETQHGHADVIHANNVLAHVGDLNGVVAGIAAMLKADGIAVVEVPYVRDLVEKREFDTIYHEHLCYFSLTALQRLFRRHGLEVIEVEHLPVHGGSLRLFIALGAHAAPSVSTMLAEERASGADSLDFYSDFGDRVPVLREELRGLMHSMKGEGQKIAGYGASAKGATLLNYCGIGRETLEFVADRSTAKEGLFTPGTHLPIVAASHLLEARPDYVLLLAWNWAGEILAQQSEYVARGGRFIIPVPSPVIT